MSQVLCSTGALIGRPNKRDFRLLKEFAQKLNCDGFEFMMYDSWYEQKEEILAFFKEQGIKVPVMHCEKQIGEAISRREEGDWDEAFRRFSINCEMAESLGASKLVAHLWDGVTSDQHFENNVEAYGRLQETAQAHGIHLLVENVVCNKENPMKHWVELAKCYPDIRFIFDTKMAAFHDEIKLLYKEEYAWLWQKGHICHYHINDYAGGYMEWAKLSTLPIGSGNIDFEEFFTFLKKTGYDDTFTVEATAFDQSGTVDTEMLNRCFQYIREHI